MNRREILAGFAATMIAAGVFLFNPPPDTGEIGFNGDAPIVERLLNPLPNVALRTHEGKEVRFYDDLLKGKTVLLNFIYTNCAGETACTLATENLAKVQKLLGKRIGRDVFMYSITLDPEHDTPKVLERYARELGVGPGWLFLTGGKDDIDKLRRALGFVNPDPALDMDLSQHLATVRYGVEQLGRWASFPSQTAPEWIVKYLELMEPALKWPDLLPGKGPVVIIG